eukprot:Gb_00513 [translate_table: standard]
MRISQEWQTHLNGAADLNMEMGSLASVHWNSRVMLHSPLKFYVLRTENRKWVLWLRSIGTLVGLQRKTRRPVGQTVVKGNTRNHYTQQCQAGTRTSRTNRCPVLYFVWMFSRHGLKRMTTELSDRAGFLVRSQGRPKNWIGMPSSMTLCRLKKCGPL